MDEVLVHDVGEVAADRAGGGLDRVGDAHHRAPRLDGVRALDHRGHERAAGDEVDEVTEERLVGVLAVVGLGGGAVEGAQLERDER